MLARTTTATGLAAAATTEFAAVRDGIAVAAGVQLAGEIGIEMIRMWRGYGHKTELFAYLAAAAAAAAADIAEKRRYRGTVGKGNGRGFQGKTATSKFTSLPGIPVIMWLAL